MTVRALRQRLLRLERLNQQAIVDEDKLFGLRTLLYALIAWHLAKWREDEALEPALARALSFKLSRNRRDSILLDSELRQKPEFNERLSDAVGRLLALQQVSFSDKDSAVETALITLYRAMPNWCRLRPELANLEHLTAVDQNHPYSTSNAHRHRGMMLSKNQDPIEVVLCHLNQRFDAEALAQYYRDVMRGFRLISLQGVVIRPKPSEFCSSAIVRLDMTAIEATEYYRGLIQSTKCR